MTISTGSHISNNQRKAHNFSHKETKTEARTGKKKSTYLLLPNNQSFVKEKIVKAVTAPLASCTSRLQSQSDHRVHESRDKARAEPVQLFGTNGGDLWI
uniref:Uncharacterized protein n=1 Tax=Rhizophora mucronata TaxID=61149 RepID=A0A2P2JFP9_RHIMU